MAFIWSGNPERSTYHLVHWDIIARPVSKGGWGLKNMHFFSLSLREKILWLVSSGGNLWSNIIRDKHFQSQTLIQWIHRFKKPRCGI